MKKKIKVKYKKVEPRSKEHITEILVWINGEYEGRIIHVREIVTSLCRFPGGWQFCPIGFEYIDRNCTMYSNCRAIKDYLEGK